MIRALQQLDDRIRDGEDNILWNCTEELGMLVYAELQLGMRPTIPF